MDAPTTLLVAVLAIINIVAVVLMGLDKQRSLVQGTSRYPEAYFFTCAAFFGALGVLAGMLVFRHKIRKWTFILGIPAMLAQNAFVVIGILNVAS